MANKLSMLSIRLKTLTIFRGLLKDPVIDKLQELLWLADEGEDIRHTVSSYSAFVARLYLNTPDLSRYIAQLVLNDENFYVKEKACGNEISASVENCLNEELELLQEICQLRSETVRKAMQYHQFLPEWDNSEIDLKGEYMRHLEELPHTGYGIFNKYHTFVIRGDKITPVKYPDSQRLDQLFGYERERSMIIRNTEALMNGRGANNMLLYGDAGTGKSSTIKAVANHFAEDGLRLIEVKKISCSRSPT